MKKMNFSYNAVTNKIDMLCGEKTIEFSFDELCKVRQDLDNVMAMYKSEHIKMFKDGDYVVDDDNHIMFIFKGYNYTHNMYACPSWKVTIEYHIRLVDNHFYDNQSFVSDGSVVYRKADPEEVAYMDYLLRKRQGVYFDKKDKKVKKL